MKEFFYLKNNINFRKLEDVCKNVYKIPIPALNTQLTYAIGKSFKYQEQFRYAITKMRTHGTLFKLQNIFMALDIEPMDDKPEMLGVEFGHIYIILYSYFLCIVLSFIVSIIERIYKDLEIKRGEQARR